MLLKKKKADSTFHMKTAHSGLRQEEHKQETSLPSP